MFFELLIMIVSVLTIIAGLIFVGQYKLNDNYERSKFLNSSKAIYVLTIAIAAFVLLWCIIYYIIWVTDYGMREMRTNLVALIQKYCF